MFCIPLSSLVCVFVCIIQFLNNRRTIWALAWFACMLFCCVCHTVWSVGWVWVEVKNTTTMTIIRDRARAHVWFTNVVYQFKLNLCLLRSITYENSLSFYCYLSHCSLFLFDNFVFSHTITTQIDTQTHTLNLSHSLFLFLLFFNIFSVFLCSFTLLVCLPFSLFIPFGLFILSK